jgi:alpha-beta hydrolase superfamily lysophospholipase
MRILTAVTAAVLLSGPVIAQEPVSFQTPDGWTIHADLYGAGDRGVVLAHGGRFTKGSWEKQARELVKAGFRVLAIDFRGFGLSKDGPPSARADFVSPLDVLAGVRYLRRKGAKTVAVVGGSMGGTNGADASAQAPGEIDRVVLIGAHASVPPETLKARKLFIVSRDDLGSGDRPRLPRIREQYEKAPEPKALVILEGSAHAQFIFGTDQADRLMREILRFLTAP